MCMSSKAPHFLVSAFTTWNSIAKGRHDKMNGGRSRAEAKDAFTLIRARSRMAVLVLHFIFIFSDKPVSNSCDRPVCSPPPPIFYRWFCIQYFCTHKPNKCSYPSLYCMYSLMGKGKRLALKYQPSTLGYPSCYRKQIIKHGHGSHTGTYLVAAHNYTSTKKPFLLHSVCQRTRSPREQIHSCTEFL